MAYWQATLVPTALIVALLMSMASKPEGAMLGCTACSLGLVSMLQAFSLLPEPNFVESAVTY